MILHFSHIGLTDGLTFMIPFGDWLPEPRLWLPHGPPLPGPGHARLRRRALGRTLDGSNWAAAAAVRSPGLRLGRRRRGGIRGGVRRGAWLVMPGGEHARPLGRD